VFAPDKILVFDPYLRDKPHLNQVFVKRFVDQRTNFGRRGSVSDTHSELWLAEPSYPKPLLERKLQRIRC
jgi:hypothetical protein